MTHRHRSLTTFRLHLILTAVIVTAGFAVVIGTALFVPLFAQLDRSDLSKDEMAGLAEYLLQLHRSYWPVVVGMIAASVTSAMMLFHRMKSPLTRFVQIFQRIGRGEIPDPLQLRKSDYLMSEANALNGMLGALTERANADAQDVFRLDEALLELEGLALEPKAAAAVAGAREAASCLRGRLFRSD